MSNYIFTFRYLILDKNNLDEGEKSLKKLRGTDDIEDELQEIMAEGNASENSESMSVWQLLKNKKLRLALFITICMHLSQQLSGIVAIFYYSTKFFEVSLSAAIYLNCLFWDLFIWLFSRSLNRQHMFVYILLPICLHFRVQALVQINPNMLQWELGPSW